jgi:hypothetical protein
MTVECTFRMVKQVGGGGTLSLQLAVEASRVVRPDDPTLSTQLIDSGEDSALRACRPLPPGP